MFRLILNNIFLRNKVFGLVHWIQSDVLLKKYSLKWSDVVYDCPELIIHYQFDDRYLLEYVNRFLERKEQPPIEKMVYAMLAAVRAGKLHLIKAMAQSEFWHTEYMSTPKYQQDLYVTAAKHGRHDIFSYLMGANFDMKPRANVFLESLDCSLQEPNREIAKLCIEIISKDELISSIDKALKLLLKFDDQELLKFFFKCSASSTSEGKNNPYHYRMALTLACQYGSLDSIKEMEINDSQLFYDTIDFEIINRCISCGRLDIIKHVYLQKISMFMEKDNLIEFMTLAVTHNKLDIVKFLYQLNREGIVNYSFLIHKALGSGDVAMLEWFQSLEHVSDAEKTQCFNKKSINNAARQNHFDMLKWLHYNRSEGGTGTDLDEAIISNNLDMVKFLHENRSEGCSSEAIQYALENHNLELAKYLLDNIKGKKWAISSELVVTLCFNEKLDIVQFIFDRIKVDFHMGQSMKYAAQKGNLAMVKLINQFPNVTCSAKAMDRAAGGGYLDVVTWLHENRTEGCTASAMDEAAQVGMLTVVQWLHENRTEGCTALAMDRAAENGHLEIVQFLHENRSEGCTTRACTGAARKGHLEVVKYLVNNRRGDVDISTAIECAADHEVLEIMKFLLEFDALSTGKRMHFPISDEMIEQDLLEMTRYLHENGFDQIDNETFKLAMFSQSHKIILWIIENGVIELSAGNLAKMHKKYSKDKKETITVLQKNIYFQTNKLFE